MSWEHGLLRWAVGAMIATTPAWGQTTWYLDASAGPPGMGTEERPFTELGHALHNPAMVSGDTILVAPGTYDGNVSANYPAVTLRSLEGPLHTTIDVSGTFPFIVRGVLDGFTVTGTGMALAFSTARHCIVRDCHERGIVANDGSLIQECTLVHNGTAISPSGYDPWVTVDGCVVWGNGACINGAVGTTFIHFNVLQALPNQYWEGGPNLIVDPLFWDLAANDVHLSPGSPCIDAGIPTSFDPDGTRADIGALTYDPTYSPVPSVYCTAAPNSVGPGARIGWSGSQSLAAGDLTLLVDGAPPNEIAFFLYGPGADEAHFGDGFRCVAANGVGIFRLLPVGATDGVGRFARRIGSDLVPSTPRPGTIEAGSTWHFQLWYRDPAGPLGNGFNLSDALAVGFVP